MAESIDGALRNYHVVSFWSEQSPKHYATPKARIDIVRILQQLGATIITISKDQLETLDSRLEREKSIASRENKKLATFLQYPLKPFLNISYPQTIDAFDFVRKVDAVSDRKIVFVHDVKSIQVNIFEKRVDAPQLDALTQFENALFTSADKLIVHSEPMAAYLTRQFHVDAERLVPLGIFDYLGTSTPADRVATDPVAIAFAGYLGSAKRTLVEKLFSQLPKRQGQLYRLYGPDFVNRGLSRDDILYRGSVDPEEIPSVLNRENNFGLLWDNLDERQRFYYGLISPHKCSLYIKAFLPPIIPSGTYIGDFVRKLNVGVVINSLSDLRDIPEAAMHVDFTSLKMLKEQVETGHFTKTALEKALT